MDSKQNNLFLNLFVLIFGMIGSGLFSAYLGKELHFDLAGYHFYNPYAFLHDRFNIDYWPASEIQVFLPPTLDFFTYYLINNFSPRMTVFILGAVQGINFALIFYINRFFISLFIEKINYQIYVAGVLAFLAFYSPMILPYLGSFTNDLLVSIFVLSFINLFLVTLKNYSETGRLSFRRVILANLLLGIGVGCKLTIAPYVIGACAALIFLPMPLKLKTKLIVVTVLCNIAGMVLSSGYWMLLLWHHFLNPFYPFLNGIFRSPYFPAQNWLEPRYMPTSIFEAIFFPFYFSTSIKPTAEFYFLDFRLLIVYVLFIALGIQCFFKKTPALFKNSYIVWFYLFFIISYIVWEIYFSIMRYMGISEMLSPVLIFLLILHLNSDSVRAFETLTAVFLFIFVSMHYTNTERIPFGDDFFNVKLPAYVEEHDKATVLMAYSWFVKKSTPPPNHYLIPFFPKNWRFSGIPFYGSSFQVPLEVKQFVEQGPKTVFLLAPSEYMPYMYKAALQLNLKASGPCAEIKSDRQKLMGDKVILCPVKASSS